MISSNTLSFLYNSPLWDQGLDEALFEKTLALTLKISGFDHAPSYELSVGLSDDAEIRKLNKNYRGHDKPTNVLSFSAYDPDEPHPEGEPINLGDIVLAYETITREALEQGKTFSDHVVHLYIHGILHLIGYDHEDDAEAEEMEALEVRILKDLGIKNPYEV